ncbi:hypothetical protein [Novosphingobium album (ex Liu et al. 2023)]|uniref:Roadblock/LAMTOR2 domain-containing protein n=1 Tax=Novosphingobium album (ex Liu et al. 2023) TaxID=3031130 RepID=A0ABT5WQ72_9SPHN|nr:hypothetical protein [Novosphingobium album (ex Liu et al. 2023)]MDE8651118.1 hypothetical protein [Novosphingobium album (ex Liu et al. 2023)]
MRDLLHDCVASAPVEEADRIREAALLLRAAPVSIEGFACAPEFDRIEALLARGAAVSAALATLGEQTPFIVSRGANGVCLASMMRPGGTEELVAEGRTVALALLSVHLTVLLALAEQAASMTGPARAAVAGARMH